jgi:hypothetical protein
MRGHARVDEGKGRNDELEGAVFSSHCTVGHVVPSCALSRQCNPAH